MADQAADRRVSLQSTAADSATDSATDSTNEQTANPETFRVRLRDDHAAIARLAEDLLPALIAKLTASGLGEIEVREGGWKARLRKPDGVPESKRPAGWGQASAGSHTGHAHASGHGPTDAQRRPCDDDVEPEEDDDRVSATSPAVGIFHPRRDLTVGMRVRTGDALGTIDVLGVRQEVQAPVDGVVGISLVEAGEAVEYGQELVRIELPNRRVRRDNGTAGPDREGLDLPGRKASVPVSSPIGAVGAGERD